MRRWTKSDEMTQWDEGPRHVLRFTPNQHVDRDETHLAFTRRISLLPCVLLNIRTGELVCATYESSDKVYECTRQYLMCRHRADVWPGDCWLVFGDPEVFQTLHGYGDAHDTESRHQETRPDLSA